VFSYNWPRSEWSELPAPENLGLRGRFQRSSCTAVKDDEDGQTELMLVAMKYGEARCALLSFDSMDERLRIYALLNIVYVSTTTN